MQEKREACLRPPTPKQQGPRRCGPAVRAPDAAWRVAWLLQSYMGQQKTSASSAEKSFESATKSAGVTSLPCSAQEDVIPLTAKVSLNVTFVLFAQNQREV